MIMEGERKRRDLEIENDRLQAELERLKTPQTKDKPTRRLTPAVQKLVEYTKAKEERQARLRDKPDISAPLDRRAGLTNRELTELFGFKSSGAVSNAVTQGDAYFREWSAGYDPEGKAWTFEGENKNRRFYPVGETSTLNGSETVV